MPFDLNPSPTFIATVKITVPGGPSRPVQVRFHHKDTADYREFIARLQPDSEMVSEIVAGFIDKPSELSDAQFQEVLLTKFPAAAADIYITYCRELGESRTKN